ncbi:Phosphorylase superfamily protein [Hibiscus syriacus]|uniref:Phosphorylase superfamily protein n=1 Tax=Hibiscus syriacus TaxID=106335 RepID=A0A6A2YD80_HIBSY|nr:Phosphorylase superfamily protein [Hibiscus syriacus]
MNQGVLQSSSVQQLMAGNHPDWWSINTMRSPPTHHQQSPPTHHQQSPSAFFPQPPPPPAFFPQFIPTSTSSWHDNQELPESWTQLLLRSIALHHASTGNSIVDTKQEEYVYARQIMAAPASSPKSCLTTTTTSFSNNMLDFSCNKAEERQPHLDRSSECNSSTATGGTLKKTRVQPSQSTFKVGNPFNLSFFSTPLHDCPNTLHAHSQAKEAVVLLRKEKLGDRITALHHLVSPFGKTDTASVLLEAIGYIRFLQSQIEALTLPYMGSGSSGNIRQQQQSNIREFDSLSCNGYGGASQREGHDLKLLNENCMKKRKGGPDDQQDSNEDPQKDLKSRGLCLVPVSCTLQVGRDNGADYWAPPPFGGGFR